MHARTLPARHGALWLVGAFTLFRRNPALLAALTFGYLLIVLLLNTLPAIGPVLLAIALPALTAMLGNGCHAIERRHPPTFAELTRGIESRSRDLARLGLLNLGASMLIIFAGIALGLDLKVEANVDQAKAADLLRRFAALMLVASPVLAAFWFAPLLTLWNGIEPMKSVFFSFIAAWRNWRAFAMYGLVVGALLMLLPALLLVLVNLVSGQLVELLAVVLRAALVFVLAPTLVASVYLSYRDVFHTPARDIDVAV